MTESWTGLCACILAAVHLFAGRLRFLDATPRSIWLSMAGGVSVAYVFLHLLPELHAGQHALQESDWLGRLVGENQEIYLVALAGLTLFYGLERLAVEARRRQRQARGDDATPPAVFALHVASFALYNLLIGYLLLHGERDNLLPYTAAIGLHFVVNDRALRAHHRQRYHAAGRWLLAAAVLGGWAMGLATQLAELPVKLLVALLAGGIILNVLKEELPQERESRFWAFLVGVAGYGALLALV